MGKGWVAGAVGGGWVEWFMGCVAPISIFLHTMGKRFWRIFPCAPLCATMGCCIMSNRLINETSPYLLQHAENPVDWYPWGEDAFARAREEDKPVFLSVGYSACHWCHVMAHESFENEETARLMNDGFVNIKVDREERPDVDSIYMRAVQAQTGRGGWPMSVFMTPDGKPFFGGTYFPPEDRHGMPGFPRLLHAIVEAYRDRRDDVVNSADELVAHLRSGLMTSQGQEPLTSEALSRAFDGLDSEMDKQHGGIGAAPKFPQPMTLEFLLRYYARSGQVEALAMADLTLEKMAHGGIYDQLGGGFHRYSVDPFWLVPHFEKMLYDNALLSRLYLHAYQITGSGQYKRIVEETLDYVLREMTGPEGGFYSSQDADSEGEEGRFFVWTPREIEEALGKEQAVIFNRYYGVTHQGNFDGRNILHVRDSAEEVASELGIDEEQLTEAVDSARAKLLERRRKRVAPGRDDKALTCWNGMMLRSFAEAAAVLGRDDYLQAALANAGFLLSALRSPQGRVMRSFKDGKAVLNGYLDDYSNLIDGLIALHEATLDLRWLDEARSLADDMLELFWDPEEATFYDTGSDHEKLIIRPSHLFDNAEPSGSAVASDVLLRLAVLTGNAEYRNRAATMLRSLRMLMSRAPMGFGHWLCVLDFYLSTPKEIAVVGPPEDPGTQALLDEVFGRFIPNRVVTGYRPNGADGYEGYPLLADKYMINDLPSAFVCENYVCMMPATDPAALAEQLSAP